MDPAILVDAALESAEGSGLATTWDLLSPRTLPTAAGLWDDTGVEGGWI